MPGNWTYYSAVRNMLTGQLGGRRKHRGKLFCLHPIQNFRTVRCDLPFPCWIHASAKVADRETSTKCLHKDFDSVTLREYTETAANLLHAYDKMVLQCRVRALT